MTIHISASNQESSAWAPRCRQDLVPVDQIAGHPEEGDCLSCHADWRRERLVRVLRLLENVSQLDDGMSGGSLGQADLHDAGVSLSSVASFELSGVVELNQKIPEGEPRTPDLDELRKGYDRWAVAE